MNEPRLTLKVAVYTILQKGDKILFLRRKNTGWSDGLYCLPAGHVDPGEMPTVAAIRETMEESGVTVEEINIKFVHVSYRKDKYVDFFFAAKTWSGKPKLMEPEKADAINWLDPKINRSKIIPSIAFVLDHIDQNIFYSEYNPID